MDSMLSWRWYTTAAEEFLCRKSSTVPHSHGVHYILTRSPAVARIANRTRPSVLPYSRLSRVISNCCQIAYPAVFAILARRVLRSRVWPFRVTWRHRSRDHWIPQVITHILLVVLTVSEIFNGERDAMVVGSDDLKRPLIKGQGHSFWYQ